VRRFLAVIHRLKAPVATDEGFVLAENELAADKVLALTDQAEVRDFVDFETDRPVRHGLTV